MGASPAGLPWGSRHCPSRTSSPLPSAAAQAESPTLSAEALRGCTSLAKCPGGSPLPYPHLTCLPWQGDLLSHAMDRGAMCMSLERVTCGAQWATSHSDKPLRTVKLPYSALLTGKLFKNVLTIQ